MQKISLLIVMCIMFYFVGNSQVQQEQEIFLKKSTSKDKTYNNNKVDQKATFIGGDSELFKFYKNNSTFKVNHFQVPDKSTYFNLYIDEKGNVYDFKIIKSVDDDHNKEIERLVNIMPKWNPAKNNNKTVKVILLDYITFQ
ncbi:energy transducer TonB [Aquimarina celericrescens]|uniref:Energy transducer TonB n=1 Tax=Aquimarina celericrescens TaxID=1964542 RepID=A0ABW5AT79_9FLAO|nr:hypothetical protein [Aquimarina celericrescens]MBQ0735254.1 hypothetical protein [Aquimarina celericrescens]